LDFSTSNKPWKARWQCNQYRDMNLLRAFIAIEIPSSIQSAIEQATDGLRKAVDSSLVRWVPPANMHLTLKFLGDVSETNLQFIKHMLMQECAQHPAFDLQIGKLGFFPNSKRPRVIWIGLKAPTALAMLQNAIETAAERLGYTKEERDFSPHLTIGRVRPNLTAAEMGRVSAALEAAHVGMLGTVSIDSVHLYQSELRPTGSVYTRLFSAPLKP
jgi:2'-5' RNA ligase